VGGIAGQVPDAPAGLGTTIVNAPATQLGARVDMDGDAGGLRVSISQASSASPMPQAA